jgi:hypothetical protein
MNPSVTTAFRRAMAHTQWMLFQPFAMGKWFGLTVVGVFAHGIGVNQMGNLPQAIEPLAKWYRTDPELAELVLVRGGIALGILMIGLTWLTSLADVISVDNVLGNHGRVREPARRLRAAAWRWFPWRLGARLFALAVVAAIAIPVTLAILRMGRSGPPMWLWGMIPVGLLAMLVLYAGSVILDDLVLPISVCRETAPGAACRESLRLLGRAPGYWFAYAGLKVGAIFAASILMQFVGCALGAVLLIVGGIAALIVVGVQHSSGLAWSSPGMVVLISVLAIMTVGLLAFVTNFISTPINVFFRAYSLAAIEEFREIPTLGRAYGAAGAPA